MVAIPTVHLNGTSKRELVNMYTDALEGVRDAITKVQCSCPNGRDFYVQSSTAINDAIAEHRQRLTKLDEVGKELETILEHLTAL